MLITQCRGVKCILGFSPELPTPLRDGALELLRERYAAGDFTNPHPQPKIERAKIYEGQRVLVDVGEKPKLGICKLSRKQSIRVLMEYMGGEREAEFDISRVSPAPLQATG